MTIREIIENTIAYANGVTGGNNPDLTGAVKALGEGFGSGGNGESGAGKTEILSGSFTLAENASEYTLNFERSVSNYVVWNTEFSGDYGYRVRAGYMNFSGEWGVEGSTIVSITTNAGGGSLMTVLSGRGQALSEDGRTLTMTDITNGDVLTTDTYKWIAW